MSLAKAVPLDDGEAFEHFQGLECVFPSPASAVQGRLSEEKIARNCMAFPTSGGSVSFSFVASSLFVPEMPTVEWSVYGEGRGELLHKVRQMTATDVKLRLDNTFIFKRKRNRTQENKF